ncbi:hypothetical protein [Bradyrhizobium sacchari]|uniref:hypothetical protein n=1 Tax=Bradyrhizobium sacchari TaxID=1399419 RepID=UPI001FDA6B21|nr:hypothetical protein [Bradyrhizobium sacchari]
MEGALVSLEAKVIWLTVIDTAATNNALAMRTIAKADLCLMPLRPSSADIEVAIPTLIAIRRNRSTRLSMSSATSPRRETARHHHIDEMEGIETAMQVETLIRIS